MSRQIAALLDLIQSVPSTGNLWYLLWGRGRYKRQHGFSIKLWKPHKDQNFNWKVKLVMLIYRKQMRFTWVRAVKKYIFLTCTISSVKFHSWIFRIQCCLTLIITCHAVRCSLSLVSKQSSCHYINRMGKSSVESKIACLLHLEYVDYCVVLRTVLH